MLLGTFQRPLLTTPSMGQGFAPCVASEAGRYCALLNLATANSLLSGTTYQLEEPWILP